MDKIRDKGGDYTQVLLAVFIVAITLLIFLIYKRRRSARRGILLTGLCDSGKTLIFSQLIHNKQIKTHTSIKENIENYESDNGILVVVDIPGHERLREKFFEKYKDTTKGIVFVVDSLTLTQDVRDTAEFLYNILVDPVVIRNCPDVLILCNKQDQTLAKGSNAVKSIFEKELNTLRITKSSQLESVDPAAKRTGVLGDFEKDFEFSGLHCKVDFAESFALSKNGSSDIEGLKKWLSRQFR